MAQRYLCFAFLSRLFCCVNTIGAAIHTPLKGEAQRIKKNQQKFPFGTANVPRLPIGMASVPHFANRCRGQCSASNKEPILVLDHVSQIRDTVLMSVYLEVRNLRESGFWNEGLMSKGREIGSSVYNQSETEVDGSCHS